MAGLGFGDEGKGSLCDFLTRLRGASLVVRYNGGPQAAHNVVTPDGVHHTFSQFGSGTLAGAETYLSKYMLIEPYALLNEADKLASIGVANPLSTLTVDADAPIITPYHWMANRIRELARGEARYGSCGFGIGELRADQVAGCDDLLTAGELWDSKRTLVKLAYIRDRKYGELKQFDAKGTPQSKAFNQMLAGENFPRNVRDYYSAFIRRVQVKDETHLLRRLQTETTIFEGAQGVLLDETHGFAPYNSWTNCTFGNALSIAQAAAVGVTRIGVLRAYSTRHGAGPFVAEDNSLSYPEAHNGSHPWQGPFRLGHFDAVMASYALRAVGGVDELAITHLDKIGVEFPWVSYYVAPNGCHVYSLPLGTEADDLRCYRRVVTTSPKRLPALGIIEAVCQIRIRYRSYGPTANDKSELKISWHPTSALTASKEPAQLAPLTTKGE